MSKLLEKLKQGKMCLISSLPANDYDLAKASWEAGADAIKVHINVFHRASQNRFGTLEENREVFEKILHDSPVPVGIVLGEDAFVAEGVLDEAIKMGFDFVSLYGHHTPASLVMKKEIANFFAVNYTYSYEEIKFISESPFLDILELSICLPESYGARLTAQDLARYRYIASHCPVPTVVPTQHVILPSDVPALAQTGVSAVMVGAISMGKEKTRIFETLKAFRKAIDELC